ncbi:phosphoenolpyruvate synthase [Paenibacillus sp. CGMCC 1.16610]|uniref:Phosphoenolpyruvate synthase n=1 Tax=Paenibacillus anseongense TaxID=2682845 RepID=A0ABW9UFD2_9BACL|nr:MULTISPECIES: phosphoenolpyruvate synthase [Paenibacillus]MBA2937512.1 phosphoenolpyruvate synthase [Paenibacillus sp. CGMCC 1.16610]MVQ36570.1 phosphoenolpyruvate synthase [Paenibacillus anseongense]
MNDYVLDFSQLDKNSLPLVGGKGANLGEMTKAGFPVPAGFCVTTEAFLSFLKQSEVMDEFFQRLNGVEADQLAVITVLGQSIREHLVNMAVPDDIRTSIIQAWQQSGADQAYAVRSSATAEDLPSASFAGQQDTYLNVRGEEALLHAVRKCWASLFTDRAISYRARNGFDHRAVHLSVVVQRMVFPKVSGIMFTADPITGNRNTVSIDASFGLGEALVSGLVSADLYQVRSGKLLTKTVSRKKLAIFALSEGGTVTKELPEAEQAMQALEDSQILELAAIGEKIKRYYGSEQDIEWCFAQGNFYIVQSRPITSLFPLPELSIPPGESPHLLVSFGHQQMMTDAMKPMGVSVLRTLFPFGKTGIREMNVHTAVVGGRVYIDITKLLTLKKARVLLPKVLTNIDEMIGLGVAEIVKQESFVRHLPPAPGVKKGVISFIRPVLLKVARKLLYAPVTDAHPEVNVYIEGSIRKGESQLSGVYGPERIVRIQEHVGSLLMTIFPQLIPYPLAGIISSRLLNALSIKWLGDTEIVHVLNRGLSGNITSEMGLMIGDLADAARPYPQVTDLILHGDPLQFREKLQQVEGGSVFGQHWDRFMELYGMRCPGEIDITRPRWREDPSTLLPSIGSHMRSMEPGEHRAKFAEGALQAEAAAIDLLKRLRAQPFGRLKAKLMSRLVSVFRGLMGLREHPKYLMMQHFYLVRKGLLDEGNSLVKKGVLKRAEDVFYLSLDELLKLAEGERPSGVAALIQQRTEELKRFRGMTPPRLMTSEGEIVIGRRKLQDAPEGAFVGTPVSAGVIEGIARVVLRPEEAKLNKGEIMVAPFTDPGWTPLFHSAVGLVMEVGGLMTHGAVVAREYGLPAVVGIDGATTLIRDGDRIRLDGTRGYVLVLERNDFMKLD